MRERAINSFAQAITSGSITGSGDVICQSLAMYDDTTATYDVRRTAIFAAVGTYYLGPMLHFWFGLSQRLVAGTSALAIAKRVVLDQGLVGPISFAFTTFQLMAWEGKAAEWPAWIRENGPAILVKNWQVWVPTVTVTFAFIPLHFRPLFVNTVALFWNVYISSRLHVAHDERVVEAGIEAVP